MNTNRVYDPGLLSRCGDDGVPCLVQAIWYHAKTLKFEVLFFNGQTRFYSPEDVMPGKSWRESLDSLWGPSDEEFAEIVTRIELHVSASYPAVFRTSMRRAQALILRRIK